MRALRLDAGAAVPALPSAVAVLAVALCSPLASLGRRADRAVEQWNEHLYAMAERTLATGDVAGTVRVNLFGLAWPFAIAFAVAPVAAALASALIARFLVAAPVLVEPLGVAWIAFCGFACASGARTMRSRRAPAAFLGALAVAAALLAAWTAAGRTV